MNPSLITDMASAFYDSCILFAASDAGLFTALAAHPHSTGDELAERCNLNPRSARLLLDACVALKLLVKNNNSYANTPESALFLVAGSPADLTGAIRYNRDVYAAWGRLGEFARTGTPVEKPELHLGDDESRTRTFVHSMHGRALGIGRSVIPLLDLSGCRKLFDVGGGPGTYSVLCAQAWPDLTCTVLDLPGVARVADELITQAELSERVKTIPGDYHTADFPNDLDVCLFFGMLHQETPESITQLFQKAYAALKPGGILYVLDMMTDASHTLPPFSALFAVNMALTTENGWVFSDEELKTWLYETGFSDFTCQPLPPPMPHWLASARKL
ncbi:MAG: methyltransferase [Kiritimatiellae bacterium]|nr:methyltransferase [Kiritimatiellia bacterium]